MRPSFVALFVLVAACSAGASESSSGSPAPAAARNESDVSGPANDAGAQDSEMPASVPDAPDATTVHVWLSDATQHLARQADAMFAADVPAAGATIDVDDTKTFQTMDGFGAAVTDTTAWVIHQKMSATQRDALMTQVFDPAKGAGISFVRVPMGASDFHVGGTATTFCGTGITDASAGLYSYDDRPAGQTDPSLAHFSIAHDLPYVLPVLKQAIALNPQLKLMANPWSPPAWMKTNGKMTNCGNGGHFVTADYGALAGYFVKFLQAYAANGVPIYAITPQNEPGQQSNYPGMNWTADEEATFIGQHLGPALAAASLAPKVLAFDYNWGSSTFPSAVLGNAGASKYVAGTAFHCYGGGSPGQGSQLHDAFPDKDVYETECSVPTDHFGNALDLVIQATRNWAKTVLTWNIATDQNGGPKTGTGCSTCVGLVAVDTGTGEATFNAHFWELAHASKFVAPGAQRIDSSGLDDASGRPQTVAFKNADGAKVLIVHNTSASPASYRVRWNLGRSFPITLAPDAMVTLTWAGDAPPADPADAGSN